jgi:hypothetical protein
MIGNNLRNLCYLRQDSPGELSAKSDAALFRTHDRIDLAKKRVGWRGVRRGEHGMIQKVLHLRPELKPYAFCDLEVFEN